MTASEIVINQSSTTVQLYMIAVENLQKYIDLHIFHNNECRPVVAISDFPNCTIQAWCYNLLADRSRGTSYVSFAPTTCTLAI